jgi:sporulation-control protein spo0M
MEFGNINKLTSDIADIKLSQFSEYAASLDAGDLKGFSTIKKYALINHFTWTLSKRK